MKIRRTQAVGNRIGGLIKGRILVCAHSGKANSLAWIKDSSNLRQDCQFQAQICRENESGDTWSCIIAVREHSHEPIENTAVYPSTRTLPEGEMETFEKLSIIGARRRTIISA